MQRSFRYFFSLCTRRAGEREATVPGFRNTTRTSRGRRRLDRPAALTSTEQVRGACPPEFDKNPAAARNRADATEEKKGKKKVAEKRKRVIGLGPRLKPREVQAWETKKMTERERERFWRRRTKRMEERGKSDLQQCCRTLRLGVWSETPSRLSSWV